MIIFNNFEPIIKFIKDQNGTVKKYFRLKWTKQKLRTKMKF